MKSTRLRPLSLLSRFLPFAAVALTAFSFTGCSSTGSNKTVGGGGGGSANNVQAINVNTGPSVAVGIAQFNIAFTSVTVCAPGSTTSCETIDGVMVDTGSFGLRILSSALTVSLPQQKDASGNPIAECAAFADGETWGPVQTADISIAGEKASSVPIQVIGSSSGSVATVPTSCSNQGPIEDDLTHLAANGILGVGNFVQDCGDGCTVSGAQTNGPYYTCPSTGCVGTTEAVSNQVANPVAFFASDNNGVIIELPAASSPETSLAGSMIFGIGTQSNNALGNATVYTLDPGTGNFTTTFNGHTLTDAAFIDSGSNAIYFLDAAATGLPLCTDLNFLYCPAATMNFTATNQGANGASGSISFSVANADSQLESSNTNVAVAPDVAGPNAGLFDWGLPFFYGRNVYVAIAGKSTPGGQGPYWAY